MCWGLHQLRRVVYLPYENARNILNPFSLRWSGLPRQGPCEHHPGALFLSGDNYSKSSGLPPMARMMRWRRLRLRALLALSRSICS